MPLNPSADRMAEVRRARAAKASEHSFDKFQRALDQKGSQRENEQKQKDNTNPSSNATAQLNDLFTKKDIRELKKDEQRTRKDREKEEEKKKVQEQRQAERQMLREERHQRNHGK
eukprot:PhF_6_TR19202/c0_g1_i2/m.28234